MAITLGEFIQEATYCFVKKNSLLASMFKTGYPNYGNLKTDITVLGMYFWLLRRIGNDYALSEDEVNAIMAHILRICKRKDLELPDAAGVVGGNPIGEEPIGGGIIDIPVVIYTTTYSGVESFTITVTHNLNKLSPIVIVTDTTGTNSVRVYPAITELTVNQLTLDFVSTGAGVITVL